MKFDVYCSCLQSDGRQLRFVRRFDSLSDCDRFIRTYRKILCRDWKIVQQHTRVTDRERTTLYNILPESAYEQTELPF